MRPQTLHDYIVFPTLAALNLNSKAACQLLIATSAQESQCGMYLKQISGPALGAYQMEPATTSDLIKNFLVPSGRLESVQQFCSPMAWDRPELISMVGELFYATAMARMNYFRHPAPLPAFGDFEGMWAYYKKYWNSPLGAATKKDFKANWDKYVMPVDFSDPTPRVKAYTSVV